MRILVVDGHPAMRLGIKVLLNDAEDMCIINETESGEEAIQIVGKMHLDLVILGLNLVGDPDGIETCRRLKRLPEPPCLLVHTAYDFTEDVSSCLLAGADSYLHKRSCCEELLETVRRTVAGERVWTIGDGTGGSRPRPCAAPNDYRLTPKEREVLSLLLRQWSNTEIAQKLYVSLPTVKTHVRSILRKFGAKSRKELFQPLDLQTLDF